VAAHCAVSASPGYIVWSRVFIDNNQLCFDTGLGEVVELPQKETEERWQLTTPQWPIMHTVLRGITCDQMMARNKSNHIQVSYGKDLATARKALHTKAAMMRALGLKVSLCGEIYKISCPNDSFRGQSPIAKKQLPMKLLVLAAGYATRLYPLTLNQAKPLLPVAGRPMMDHVLEKFHGALGITECLVVVNSKFAKNFRDWAATTQAARWPITIVDDGSTSPENALGAIGDILFTIRQQHIVDDLVIVAGDNLFTHHLAGFISFAEMKNEALLGIYDVGDLEAIKKYNNITTDETGRITHFEEKPQHPTGTRTGIALYYYPARHLRLFEKYVAEGNNADQPGRFIQWLYKIEPVYTWEVPGKWLDVGSKETLEAAEKLFSN